MINSLARNSSILAMGAILVTMAPTCYNSSTAQIPNIQYSIYREQSTVPNVGGESGFKTMNQNIIKTYSENKKGDFMVDNVRRKKLISTKVANHSRNNNSINDLGYYEENETEMLEVIPRKKIKVKAKIVSSRRVTSQLS